MIVVHPSLTAPLAFLPLQPQQIMKVNEKCWCRSDKKWKNCHRDRDLQTPTNIFEQAEKLRDEFSEGYCSYVDASGVQCAGKAISSHTVQRGGGLAAIQEKGHVLSPKTTLEDLVKHNGRPQIKSLGIRKASTFPGFCAVHDSEVFLPIEKQNAVLDRTSAFLLSYRSICLELFKKQSMMNVLPILKEMDRGKPFSHQVQIQETCDAFHQGVLLGVRDITTWKLAYDNALHAVGHPDFHYVAIIFEGTLPLAASTAWQIENDFAGNVLQRLGTGSGQYEHITFNLTQLGKNTAAVFGWIGSKSGPSSKFVESFLDVPDARKPSLMTLMAFEYAENIFMNPGWWAGLGELERTMLQNRILSGGPTQGRKAASLSDNKYTTIVAPVVQVQSG